MTKLSKRPVLIVWVDSHAPGEAGWLEPKRIPTKMTYCKSVGYVLKESKKSITLAAHIAGPADQVDGAMTIPICAIVKRKVLR